MVNRSKFLLASFVWLLLLGLGVVAWKWVFQPQRQEAEVRDQRQREQRQMEATQGTSRYRHEISIGLDSFSGYAVLRSEAFQQSLADSGIRLSVTDDGADYARRMDRLESGEIQFAAFPIDALLKVSSQRGRLPATIVAIIDETRGADAMVAYRQRYPDIDALNDPLTRFILVGDSPSETLLRVVMRDFELSDVATQSVVSVSSPEAIIQAYRKSGPTASEVFVTWEPFVSQLLENDQLHVLVDSSKFLGYIVDALVVSRDYLLKQPEVVESVLRAYFDTLHSYRNPADFKQLILGDAKKTAAALSESQVDRLIDGIRWKNTQENYAHFGLRSESVVHIEDMLSRISSLLIASRTIEKDPTDGQFSRLFYDRALKQLQTNRFLPDELVRTEGELSVLSDSQWDSLVPVGTLRVPELVFARGTATLTPSSQLILDDLADKLRSWPAYYLRIEGNAASGGNEQANLALAMQRAQAARQYLRSLGVAEARMKSVSGEVGQSRVVFILSELPY
jgi:outer membrane protein OmpA-like peptidoglycan-associated protein/ABC-type nitrate/sulfonate/bicarbonate transport system substrate-binding protein